MRKWIKEHPWRLEIVPVVLIVLGAILPLLSMNETPVQVHVLPLFRTAHIWLVVSGVMTMFTFWIGMLQLDHD